jgi:hypothetical protein
MTRHLISPSRPPQAQPTNPIAHAHRAKALSSGLPCESTADPAKAPPTTQNHHLPQHHTHTPAAAGPGRSEHWRRSPKTHRAQRESPSSPKPTCERRTHPAEPDQYSSGAGRVRSELWKRTPGLWREAPRLNLQSFPASAGPIPRSPTHDSKPPSPPTSHPHPAAAGSGRNEHWRRSPNPSRNSAKAPPPPSLPARAGPIPRSAVEALIPSASPGTLPPHRKTGESTRGYAAFLQNAPVVRHTRGFTPGWYRGRDGRYRPPLPPNRTSGFPASGSPVGESPACGGTGTFGPG